MSSSNLHHSSRFK